MGYTSQVNFKANNSFVKGDNSNSPSTPPPDPVGYGGQWGNYTDVESGYVRMGYRYYDPTYCRFLTRDPQGYAGGINLYAYCRNNPVGHLDPMGLQGNELKTAAGAATSASLAAARLAIEQSIARQAAATAVEGTALGLGTEGIAASATQFGPHGWAVAAIIAGSGLVYKFSGVPLADFWFGPDTLNGSPALPGFTSLYARARFKRLARNNDLYELVAQTRKGPVGALAEVTIQGNTLILHDVTIYGEGTKALTGLVRDMIALRRQAANDARAAGFSTLKITGQRHPNSSSKNPGHYIDATINLK